MIQRSSLGPVVCVFMIVLCASQVAVAQVDWQFEELCIEPGPPGSWNPGGIVLGDVIFDGALYHMYLIGGPGASQLDFSWSVGHWVSADKLSWIPDPANPVLEPEPGQWDEFSIYHIGVLFDGAMFHMWYGAPTVYQGEVHVGYATNPDGWGDWDKYPGNPLASLEPGAPGTWEDHGLAPSTVLFNGSLYEMWYVAVEWGGPTWGTWRLGYATSSDGLEWIKHPNPVLDGSAPWEDPYVYHPEVVHYGSGLSMWYSGAGQAVKIGYAISQSGVDWARWKNNPVLAPTPPCTVLDSIAVILEGETAHGWVSHCDDIYYVTSPLEIVFFDDHETGGATVWSSMVQ